MKTVKPSSRRPARKASLEASPLNGYLAGAAGTAALLGAPQAEAAVTAVTFGFGTEFNTLDGGYRDFSVGSFGNLFGNAYNGSFFLGDPYEGSFLYRSASGLPAFFSNSTIIGGGGNGTLSYGWFQHRNDPDLNFTSDQLNKNIAFKTSTNNFGWANVDWIESTKTLEINSAFVESVANTPITISASAVPEPSRALLALAGLGGVALRRRRKQAA